MEIEIVTFVVKGSAKLTVPTDWQEQIQVGSRSVALRRVFDLKLRGIHLTEIILKVWVIIDVPKVIAKAKVENRQTNRLSEGQDEKKITPQSYDPGA